MSDARCFGFVDCTATGISLETSHFNATSAVDLLCATAMRVVTLPWRTSGSNSDPCPKGLYACGTTPRFLLSVQIPSMSLPQPTCICN